MFRRIVTLALAVFALNAFAAVDANRANRAELETVKGIGPGLSAKILKARASGTFAGWADMVERVPGVGPGNAARLSQAGLTVGGTVYEAAAQPAPTKRARRSVAASADKPARKAAKASAT